MHYMHVQNCQRTNVIKTKQQQNMSYKTLLLKFYINFTNHIEYHIKIEQICKAFIRVLHTSNISGAFCQNVIVTTKMFKY